MRKKDVYNFVKNYEIAQGRKKPGSETAIRKIIGAELGITAAAVWMWPEVVPKSRAFELYVWSGGNIPLNESDYA